MGSKAPKAPPAPDPNAVAAAQTGSNVTTAIANSWLGNANVNSPLGSVKNTQQKGKDGKPLYRTVTDPSTGKSYQVPVFQQDIRLSPAQQKLLDQQNALGATMNDAAMSQVQRLAQHLQGNPNLSAGLPDVRGGPGNISLDGLPELADNMDEYRGQVEAGLMERMNPQLQRDYDALESKLVNQGLVRGSEAFKTAMDENRRQANDARTQVFLASGGEARSMMDAQRANRGQLFNERVTTNNDTRANQAADMAWRNQMLQERLTERNQPINEITALMGGGQVSMPQFQGYNPGQVEGTPVGSYIYNTANLQQQQAQQKAAANGQMWSDIGKIGAGLFAWSDRRLKRDIRYVHTDAKGIDWFVFRYVPSVGLNGWQYGVMAQDVMKTHPEAVVEMPNGYLAVAYGRL